MPKHATLTIDDRWLTQPINPGKLAFTPIPIHTQLVREQANRAVTETFDAHLAAARETPRPIRRPSPWWWRSRPAVS